MNAPKPRAARRSALHITCLVAGVAALLLAACAPREEAGGGPDARPRNAASSGHPAVSTGRAASLAGFRPHVEFTVPLERAGGAVDWGSLRLVVRVVVRLGRLGSEESAGVGGQRAAVDEATLAAAHSRARAEAERTAMIVAAGVRVDSRDTLANLVADAGALRRWTAAGLRPLARRLLPTGELEEVYELPLSGGGGIIHRLYERASRTADVRVRSALRPAGPALAEAPSRSAPVPPVSGALPAAPARGPALSWRSPSAILEDPWGIDWSLLFFKGMAGEAPPDVDAAVIVIDGRGTGLAPALFPAILNEKGEPIYSAAVARRERVIGEGLVQYVELGVGMDLAALAGPPRFRPQVIVKAVAAEGPLRANIVLDAEGARRLRAEKEALEQARVVIVLGDEPPGDATPAKPPNRPIRR